MTYRQKMQNKRDNRALLGMALMVIASIALNVYMGGF